MSFHRKIDEFRAQIRREQHDQYFSSVRCQLRRELKQLEAVEWAKEEEVLLWLNANATNSSLDFGPVCLFLNYNGASLSHYFAQQFTACILRHFQHSLHGIHALCILLDNCQPDWQESGEILCGLLGEHREKQELCVGVLVVYQLFKCSQRKETFLWIREYQERLVHQMGCSEAFILLLLELSQYEELMPSERVLFHLLGESRRECSISAFVRICQLACYFRNSRAQLLFEVVRWATDCLKKQSHELGIQALLQVLSAFSHRLDSQQMQAFLRDGVIDHLVSLCKDLLASQRVLLLRCLCDFLNSLPDDILISILPNIPLYETLVAALSIVVGNADKFRLLSSLALIFAADPHSIACVCRLDLLAHLLVLSESNFTQLRTISCMMLDEYYQDQ